MNCGFVMLSMRIIAVRGKKGDCRGNIRAIACRQPVDADNNTMIEMFLTWKIKI